MLTGIQFITGDPITYTYDGDGLRTSKSGRRNTQYYIVDGQYVGEKTTISGVEYLITYLYGDNGVAGINVNGEDYYFVKNIQGDIIAILYADGSLLATYEYDAYGYFYAARNSRGTKITSQSNVANLNPFRYRGYMYDQETGFYYLRSRYYDPEVGRFLNADVYVSTSQGFDGNNMFAYCSNNPILYDDPTGTFFRDLWEKIKSGVKEVTEKASDLVDEFKETTSNINGTYTIGGAVSGTPGIFDYFAQAGISFDTKGNVAIQTTYGSGFICGTPGVSANITSTITGAPTVYNLEGMGYQIGGEVSCIPNIGADFVIIPDETNNTGYIGFAFSGGLGSPSANFHVDMGYTNTIYSFNVYDVIEDVFNWVKDW